MKEHSTRDLTWGVVFLCAGVILLMNNLGIVDYDVWRDLWKWWPVILIAVGIRVIFHRTSAWYLGYLGPILILATVAWAVYSYSPEFKGDVEYLGRKHPMSLKTFKNNVPADPRVKSVDVTLSMDAGDLNVSAGDASDLLSADVTYDRTPPSLSSSVQGDSSRVELRDTVHGRSGHSFSRHDLRWDISLTPALPVTLDCSLGAGNADIDLTRVRATNIAVQAGAGNVTIRMPTNVDKLTADISAGAGMVTVDVPKGVGLHVAGSAGVGMIDLSSVGGEKKVGVAREIDFSTPDYAKAAKKMDIKIKAGAGTIAFATE
jgi:hypothetical protein